jgi:biotin carboxyl carrier protein
MKHTFRHRDRQVSVELQRRGSGHFRATIDGEPHELEGRVLDGSTVSIRLEGDAQMVRLARVGQTYHVAVDGRVYVLAPEASGGGDAHHTLATPEIIAPMPGKVLSVLVEEGQEVASGDGLLILEAMKMENRIVAEAPAVVRRVHVTDGQMVDGGALLIELEYQEPEGREARLEGSEGPADG